MFKKSTIIIGLILLLVVGILASLGWAEWQRVGKKVTTTEERKTQEAKVEEIQETSTAKERQKETPKEEYVRKEIIFLPWGSGKGEVGLREIEYSVQGMETKTTREGAPKLEVDKNGNIYIWNEDWSKLPWWMKKEEIKRIDNPYVHKYVKEKITKGKEITERYRYDSSFSLEKEREPLVIEKLKNDCGYEIYRTDDKSKIKVIDKSGKLLKEIELVLENYFGYYTEFIGVDKEGNIYLLIDSTFIGAVTGPGSEEWRLEVHKYSKEGSLLAKIKLSDDITYTSRTVGQRERITVDKEGNIYQLLPKKDGVHILKWEIK